MDLQTIETKLLNVQYANISDYAKDMSQIWSNAMTFENQYTGKSMSMTHFVRNIDHELDEYKFLLNVYRHVSTNHMHSPISVHNMIFIFSYRHPVYFTSYSFVDLNCSSKCFLQ